jgi:putative NIF3 family GTP cyclohydrolase 1 type 2
MDADQPQFTVK